MNLALRPTLAVLGAAVVLVVGLAAALAGQAQTATSAPAAPTTSAATSTVRIVQSGQAGTDAVFLTAVRAVAGQPHVLALTSSDEPAKQLWIKQIQFDAYATYESVKFPGKCIEVRKVSSGDPLTLGPCENANGMQKWKQGFGTATFRALENLATNRIATYEPAGQFMNGVVQRPEAGLPTQLWAIVPSSS
jgi:hypothetical protein